MFRRLGLLVALFLGYSVCGHAATCYIEEYTALSPIVVNYQAATAPGVAKQTVAIGGSSTQSAAFSATTRLIRLECDATASVEIGGTNPTATATSARFSAGVPEYFMVSPGDKLAVITNN